VIASVIHYEVYGMFQTSEVFAKLVTMLPHTVVQVLGHGLVGRVSLWNFATDNSISDDQQAAVTAVHVRDRQEKRSQRIPGS
jgi:hypothetical protein